MPTVELAGYPPIVRMNFLQTSGHKAGRMMVDTLVNGPTDITNLHALPR